MDIAGIGAAPDGAWADMAIGSGRTEFGLESRVGVTAIWALGAGRCARFGTVIRVGFLCRLFRAFGFVALGFDWAGIAMPGMSIDCASTGLATLRKAAETKRVNNASSCTLGKVAAIDLVFDDWREPALALLDELTGREIAYVL